MSGFTSSFIAASFAAAAASFASTNAISASFFSSSAATNSLLASFSIATAVTSSFSTDICWLYAVFKLFKGIISVVFGFIIASSKKVFVTSAILISDLFAMLYIICIF